MNYIYRIDEGVVLESSEAQDIENSFENMIISNRYVFIYVHI
jgi:hypothetical protein